MALTKVCYRTYLVNNLGNAPSRPAQSRKSLAELAYQERYTL